jgi:hypothetical protein
MRLLIAIAFFLSVLTAEAADSGGSGYRTLRIPNAP